ncbi:RcnB family protein [Ramlibacter sp. XY19]|uniref:hypothetical protein n=1 Tax=Ramlibacter paludis TaxID=2908000 RepID=UPI0023DAEA3D|nr:hypothetical protein [Ramlibacter paludis]MCG2592225.1 RcnB family protein [Ramlibacter paludis]
MSVPFRIAPLAGLLLLAASSFATAESPLPDPVAPAVLGRPVDQIKPVRPAKSKPAAKPAAAPKTAALKLVPSQSLPVPLAPAAPSAPLVQASVQAAPAAPAAPAATHGAKQALDDRFDPNARLVDNVGQGSHLARKPLPSGAYFSSRTQAMLRQYYASQPASGKPAGWKIGEPLPPKAVMSGVPDNVRAALPRLPPGHQYVQVDGEVVLLALPSKMVVDGVSRSGS